MTRARHELGRSALLKKRDLTKMRSGTMPERIADEKQLDAMLSEPPMYLVDILGALAGDIIVLGAAGKMGPTLSVMAKRASAEAGIRRKVIAVSRFSNSAARTWLEKQGVETIRGDLLEPGFIESLPAAENVVFMAGMKFGSTGNEALTWAMNAFLPALVCRRYAASRIVAFSTGNVYGMVPLASGGSVESDPLRPQGEYAVSCLGRERIFEHFSRVNRTRTALIRLNYACELRYGVLPDLASRICDGLPVNTEMAAFNVIWQADANAMALAALSLAGSPPFLLNVTGPETISVRAACEFMGCILGKQPNFQGEEASDAFLNNAALSHSLFGYPRVPARTLMAWTADWVRRGGATLGKPTHFDTRNGRF